jgi:hypothetical protein
LDSNSRDIDVEVAAEDSVVDVVRIHIEGNLHAIRECRAIGIGRGIPLIIADQVEALAGLQVGKLVRATRHNRVSVLGSGVLALGHWHRVGLLRQKVEGCKRLIGVEDDCVLIGRLNSRVGVRVR